MYSPHDRHPQADGACQLVSGLEDVVFAGGAVRNAARFKEVNSDLSQYVGVQSYKHVTVTLKGMAGQTEPFFIKPAHPV